LATTQPAYERNPDFIFRKIIDEAVLVPVHQDVADMDCIYTLNEVASFIWSKLEQSATQADLLISLLDEYEADPDALAADLERFLGEMTEIGALRKV